MPPMPSRLDGVGGTASLRTIHRAVTIAIASMMGISKSSAILVPSRGAIHRMRMGPRVILLRKRLRNRARQLSEPAFSRLPGLRPANFTRTRCSLNPLVFTASDAGVMARCASSTNREDWARCLRNNVVDCSDVQMRCKAFCRPGSHHDQIRVPPFRNVQDLLCRWSLLDDVGGVAP